MTHHIWDNSKMILAIIMYNVWKMIKAQLKLNFDPTFLLSLIEKVHVEERVPYTRERERERERKIWSKS
jgi:hypothetical protein